MKIELKNIHFSEPLSEETYAFSANLYINDIKVGSAENRGHGGNTAYYSANQKGAELIKKAEDWCSKRPHQKHNLEGREFTLPVTLESYIYDLVHAHVTQKDLEKFRRKVDKATQKGILFGIPDRQYRAVTFKMSLQQILEFPRGEDILKNTIVKTVIPAMKEGDKILNTNIPEKIFKDAGLSEKDYVPTTSQSQNKAVKKSKGKGL